MVLFTMTTAMVEAIEKLQSIKLVADPTTIINANGFNEEMSIEVEQQLEKGNASIKDIERDAEKGEGESCVEEPLGKLKVTAEAPSLLKPKPGNPILHNQIIDLWRVTRAQNVSSLTLDTLMRGSQIYTAPPEPKQEPACLSTNPGVSSADEISDF